MAPYVSGLPFFQRVGNPLGTYASMVGCLDTTADLTGYNPIADGGFAGYDSSIFSPMGMGFGMNFCGWGPGSEFMNMSMDQYLEKMDELKRSEMKRGTANRQYANALEFSADAEEDTINKAVGNLNRLIKNNRIDEICREDKSGAYSDLLRATKESLVRAGYSEEEIAKIVEAEAQKVYYTMTGVNLIDDIKTHCDNSFVQGMKQGVLFGYGEQVTNKNTRDEVISKITGEYVPTGSEHSRNTGKVISEILQGVAVAGLAILVLRKGGNLKKLWPWGEAKWFAKIDKQIKAVEGQKTAIRNHIIAKHGLEKDADDVFTIDDVFQNHLDCNNDDVLVKGYKNLEAELDRLHKAKSDRYTGILNEETEKLTKKADKKTKTEKTEKTEEKVEEKVKTTKEKRRWFGLLGPKKVKTPAPVVAPAPVVSPSIDENLINDIKKNMNGGNSSSILLVNRYGAPSTYNNGGKEIVLANKYGYVAPEIDGSKANKLVLANKYGYVQEEPVLVQNVVSETKQIDKQTRNGGFLKWLKTYW